MRFTFATAVLAACVSADDDFSVMYFGLGFVYGATNYSPQLHETHDCFEAMSDYGSSIYGIYHDVKEGDWFSAWRNWHHFRKMSKDDVAFVPCGMV